MCRETGKRRTCSMCSAIEQGALDSIYGGLLILFCRVGGLLFLHKRRLPRYQNDFKIQDLDYFYGTGSLPERKKESCRVLWTVGYGGPENSGSLIYSGPTGPPGSPLAGLLVLLVILTRSGLAGGAVFFVSLFSVSSWTRNANWLPLKRNCENWRPMIFTSGTWQARRFCLGLDAL
eukprot:4065852-Pyramimonas_sp.AAC.1